MVSQNECQNGGTEPPKWQPRSQKRPAAEGVALKIICDIYVYYNIYIYIYTSADPCIPCTRMFVSVLSDAGIRGPAQ